ncbi:MAG: PadR family transcriptional regulator [Desulfurococcales archaeon ex4484_58]|nr:MAG: PadR family transcriptional regulator [Desulfurococcales archaeon ex4484_58]
MRANIMKLFILLLIDYYKPHGYELMKRIRIISRNLIKIGPGTIYPLLLILKSQKLIREIREDNGRKKKYDLTEEGREILRENLPKLRDMLNEILAIIDEELSSI